MFTSDEMGDFDNKDIPCVCGHVAFGHYWLLDSSNACQHRGCGCVQFTPQEKGATTTPEQRTPKVGDTVLITYSNKNRAPALGEVTQCKDLEFRAITNDGIEHRRYYVWEGDAVLGWSWPTNTGTSNDYVTNEQGGRQSDVPYAFHLLPFDALLAMAACVKKGHDKYDLPGDQQNWKKISIEEHKNHEITHSYLGLSGDTSDNHYVNAAVRAMFALQLHLESKNDA